MKKTNIFLLVLSLICIIFAYLPSNNTNEISKVSSSIFPHFVINDIIIRGNSIQTIKISNEGNYEIIYKTSDSTKIRIIDSTNNYIKIERLQPFIDNEWIDLFVNNQMYDRCYISCFNEIIKIEDIAIYEENSNVNLTRLEGYKYEEKYYNIMFSLKKLNENKDYETDTLLELEEQLSNNLSNNYKRTIKDNICYYFYLDFNYVFNTASYKTIFFSFDNLKYAITLERSK